jgi:CDK inhibitor PHO81
MLISFDLHQFLAKRNMVQITLGHPFSEASSDNIVSPVKLYNRTDLDGHLGSWSSLKLVMTSKSDISAIPHSVVLPLADEREIFSFQVDDLNNFALDLSLYPTFGSKVIGRAVVLPSAFQGIRKSTTISVPLLDHNLKNIGEVAFHAHCVKPFEGAQLEIGGRVETYWKSTVAAPNTGAPQDHAHQFQPHRPLSISTSSPSMRSATGTTAPKASKENKEGGFVTGSSLSGEYVRLVVQITRDYQPVAYPEWHLPVSGFDVGVSEATLEQCLNLAKSLGRELHQRVKSLPATATPSEWSAAVNGSIASLSDVLKVSL